MNMFRELRRREQFGRTIRVVVVGQGAMGRGAAAQLAVTPGMSPAILVSRNVTSAVETWVKLGFGREDVVVSDDMHRLAGAVERGLPAVSRDVCVATGVRGVEAVVEATGRVEDGARAVLSAIHAGKHVVVIGAALDATIGCYLCERARQQGVVYTHSDGTASAALMRLLEWVNGLGGEVLAAVQACDAPDVFAVPENLPESHGRWRSRLQTACSFVDGTQMNLESAVLANASGLLPTVRGMLGVRTDRRNAVRDFVRIGAGKPMVDYAVSKDLAGGVFVIARCEEPERVGHWFEASRLGKGPDYLFLRPHGLSCAELPLSIGEAVIVREPTLAPRGAPVAEVVAIAKRDLREGEHLDGIGGSMVYGEIDTVEAASGLLPIGLVEGARLRCSIRKGDPIPRGAVEYEEGAVVPNLRHLQDTLFSAFQPTLMSA